MISKHFSLCWDSYENNICKGLTQLQQHEEFVDMTLAADGHYVKVHQTLVALASPYLKEIIKSIPSPHPVIFLNNINHEMLCHILEYIYTGQVQIAQEKINAFIESAKSLRINGIHDGLTHEDQAISTEGNEKNDFILKSSYLNPSACKREISKTDTECISQNESHVKCHRNGDQLFLINTLPSSFRSEEEVQNVSNEIDGSTPPVSCNVLTEQAIGLPDLSHNNYAQTFDSAQVVPIPLPTNNINEVAVSSMAIEDITSSKNLDSQQLSSDNNLIGYKENYTDNFLAEQNSDKIDLTFNASEPTNMPPNFPVSEATETYVPNITLNNYAQMFSKFLKKRAPNVPKEATFSLNIQDNRSNTILDPQQCPTQPVNEDNDSHRNKPVASIAIKNLDSSIEDESKRLSGNLTDTALQYTVSNQGSVQLILNRYMYYIHHSSNRGTKKRWRCVDYRRQQCRAYVDTDGERLVKRYNTHKHPYHDKKILMKVGKKLVFSTIASAMEANKVENSYCDIDEIFE